MGRKQTKVGEGRWAKPGGCAHWGGAGGILYFDFFHLTLYIVVFKYIRNKLLNFYCVIIFLHIELIIFIVRVFKCKVLITNES